MAQCLETFLQHTPFNTYHQLRQEVKTFNSHIIKIGLRKEDFPSGFLAATAALEVQMLVCPSHLLQLYWTSEGLLKDF